jgi:MtaA/CmuA family methyltransferase
MTGRERVLGMIEGREIDRLPLMPITMMFAADLAGVRYGEYARDYRVLVEAQVRTAEEFDFDYVSAISDPAREAADFGAAIEWYENQPPALAEHDSLLGDKAGLGALKQPDPLGGGRMHDRVKAIELFRRRVAGARLIEGWVEGPCAEAADLRGINRLMLDFYDDPQFIRALFDAVVDNGMRFAGAQIQAGADIIGVGDAAASLVGPRFYDEFVWPAEKRLVDGIHAAGGRVRLHICGNTRKILAGMGKLGCEIVDLDFLSPLGEGRAQMGPNQVLLGNIDPVKVLRDGSPETVTNAVAECHRQAGPKFIVGAGCEVVRDSPHVNLRALCQYRCRLSAEGL